ncbi:sulfotransferase family protein [Flexithrix dorotheae]|uniref:sulfotransferase family protein n=1 Tax=Flexithrix dorotheae TaxID=70993 RepID=UPI000360722B|nr:sulfotransferase [Flexithrix dorotheae]
MSKFKLPPISPLAGTTLPNFLRVLAGNKPGFKHLLKVGLTFILVAISTPFHWFEHLIFKKKQRSVELAKAPVFIIGHWRSGTTFLHNLLTTDPEAGYVTTYQSVYPNNLKSKFIFKNFMRSLMPGERPGDGMKINVDYPQEDEYALSNITHQSFYHFFYFPSNYYLLYKKYVRFNGLSDREKEKWKGLFKEMAGKALVNTKGERLILKNPVNTGRILTLLEIFPHAKFIFLIRNPVIVYLSTKKFFTELFPTLNLEIFSNEEISHMILDLYVMLLNDYLSDKKLCHEHNLIEIRYEHLKDRPLSELEKIYSKLSIGEYNELEPVFSQYLESQNGHRKNGYKISRKELTRVVNKLNFAMEQWHYTVPAELEIYDD